MQVASTGGLVLAARNRTPRQPAFEQGSDRAMANEKNARFFAGLSQCLPDSVDDAGLCVNRALPAVPAFFRFGEEGVSGRLEGRGLQKAGRRAVVFAHCHMGLVCNPKRSRDDRGCLDGLALVARYDSTDGGEPRLAQRCNNAATTER